MSRCATTRSSLGGTRTWRHSVVLDLNLHGLLGGIGMSELPGSEFLDCGAWHQEDYMGRRATRRNTDASVLDLLG